MASILVLLMSAPGFILFYAGMVHRKNVLSVLAQGMMIIAIVTIMWVAIGYSLSFASQNNTVLSGFIGNLNHAFLWGINQTSDKHGLPTYLFVLFELGFAIVSPMLIIGGVAERMRIQAILCFMVLWQLLCFYPICHWLWGGGWLHQLGVLDYAGGLVVHVNAGIASLIIAVMLGRRSYLKLDQPIQAQSTTLVITGTGLIWIGWFGFNAGNAFGANSNASLALLNTQISASISTLIWLLGEWKTLGKPSVTGLACGILSGLVAVTPGAGYIGPLGALITGALAGLLCFYGSRLKHFLRYDDALDAFSVHGIGGIIGSLLVSIFALKAFGGIGLAPGISWIHQLMLQGIGTLVVISWSGLISFLILLALKYTIGIKLTANSALQGLDRSTLKC